MSTTVSAHHAPFTGGDATSGARTLVYPASAARAVLRRWRPWVREYDEVLASSVILMNFPASQPVIPALRGASVVVLRAWWPNSGAAAASLMNDWVRWARPLHDEQGTLALATPASRTDATGPAALLASDSLDDLADAAIDVLVLATFPEPGRAALPLLSAVRHAGAPADGAQGYPWGGEFLVDLVGMPASHAAVTTLQAHLHRAHRALAPYRRPHGDLVRQRATGA